MKRALLLCWVFCIMLTALCGCEQEPTYTVQSDDPIESYDNESRIVIEGPDTGESTEHIPAEGDFVVKGKKYVYQLLEDLPTEEVVILSVANETETNYEVTVTITYLDESGAVLKEESQTYQDIAAGNNTYYVFRPKIAFADYRYSLSVKEYDGPCYLSNIVPYEWILEEAEKTVWKAHVPELFELEDYTMYQHLTTKIPYKNENDIFIYAMIHLVVFDNRGEIAYLGSTGAMLNAGEMVRSDATLYFTLDEITANPKSWPEHLQGDVQAMVIPFRALTKQEAEQIIGRPIG